MKNIDWREFISGLAIAGVGLASINPGKVLGMDQAQKITRIGIIGLDTSQENRSGLYITLLLY